MNVNLAEIFDKKKLKKPKIIINMFNPCFDFNKRNNLIKKKDK